VALLRRLLTITALAAVAAALLARWLLVIVTVRGESMVPTYQPGDRVLVLRRLGRTPRRGDVVVIRRPSADSGWRGEDDEAAIGSLEWWIKRVAAVPGDEVTAATPASGSTRVPPGHVFVLGDNPDSSDSRRLGFVPLSRVMGSVVARMPSRS